MLPNPTGPRLRLTHLAAALSLSVAAAAQLQFADLRKAHLPTDAIHGVFNSADDYIAYGDVDGDGDVDLVAGWVEGFATPTRLYLNDGSGVFADVTDTRMPANADVPSALALGDVDDDGDLDLVIGHVARPSRLYLNDGTGRFADGTAGRMPGFSLGVIGVVLDDFNGDDHLDIVFGNTTGFDRVLLNDGTGAFPVVRSLPSHTGPSVVIESLDIEGDGDRDLLVAARTTQTPSVFLFRNDGTGLFTDVSATQLPAGMRFVTSVTVADLDGDADTDVVVTSLFGPTVLVNDGSGSFANGTASAGVSSGSSSQSAALGDVDSDGDVDLLIEIARELRLYRNGGTGRFAFAGRVPSFGSILPEFVELTDLDGDGDLDLTLFGMRRYSEPAGALALNDGTGSFRSAADGSLDTGVGTGALAVADVDGDGDGDVVRTTSAGSAELFLNDGAGTFAVAAGKMPPGSYTTRAIAAADVDGDGDPDLVLANSGTSQRQNRLYLNDGAGQYVDATGTRMPVDSDDSRDVVITDVDGDGDADLFFANVGRNRLYLNDGNGSFVDGSARIPPDSDGTYAVAAGDVDGDGDDDIVCGTVGASGARRTRLYLNDGTGAFAAAGSQALPNDDDLTNDVAVVDVDQDGDLDIVLANAQQDRLYLNDGGGTFTDATASNLPANPTYLTSSVAVGDVDGDGAPDIVLGSTPTSYLYINDGGGRFEDQNDRMPSARATSTVLADTDGDGDRDLVLGHQTGVAVFPNLLRQLHTPYLARIDRTFRIDAYARFGPYHWSSVAFPFVADALGNLPLPSIGTVLLDPSRALPLPPLLIPEPAGVASASFVLPDIRALVGVSLHAQAVLVQLPNDVHMTNLVTDVIVDL